ncbi:hypothetical protein BDD12DRAFT_845542 [Trichophaea hybrida]|nr:hypothetical protein BDD12DRAFT_845542 [Trichophaea hybrida]
MTITRDRPFASSILSIFYRQFIISIIHRLSIFSTLPCLSIISILPIRLSQLLSFFFLFFICPKSGLSGAYPSLRLSLPAPMSRWWKVHSSTA